MTRRDALTDAIRAFYTLPSNIEALRGQARFDLFNGPYDHPGTDYPGFEKACRALQMWCDEKVTPLWYCADTDDCISMHPSDEDIEAWEYREVSRRIQLVALFGRELAEFLS
jgi:hypothetical protein